MAEDTMLQEAIEALRSGDRASARDFLAQLLKSDQDNATYWVWMSAAVETEKERLYCLQTALQLDSGNTAAKRGLILLGAIPPDASIPPFPLNYPPLWEERIIEYEAIKPKGLRAAWDNPVSRSLILLGIVILVFAVVMLGFVLPRQYGIDLLRVYGPSPTYTSTPTSLMENTRVIRTSTPTFIGPTPLWMMLPAPYTPTPRYVNTPHSALARDVYRAAVDAYEDGDWPMVISFMQQVVTVEPEAADAFYYMGLAYSASGDYRKALEAYSQSITINSNFAPAYLGRALTNKVLGNSTNTIQNFNEAIRLDPSYFDAFAERGIYFLEQGSPEAAVADLEKAKGLNPSSPLVYLYLAQAYLKLGNSSAALEAALKANELDITLLPAYLVLGMAYQADGRVGEAVGVLQTYTLYQPNDAQALSILGAAYNATGDYAAAVDVLNRALGLNRNMTEAYAQRGIAYMDLGETTLAEQDFKKALEYDSRNFNANYGMGRIYLIKGQAGSAFMHLERAVGSATTDAQKAQAYYWNAIALEQLGDAITAAQMWERLLALPEQALSPEMRAEAQGHLWAIKTPTPSRTPATTTTPSATTLP